MLNFKKGRGKLGLFKPLLGAWRAEGKGEMGGFVCERTFSKTLQDKYVKLDCVWSFKSKGKAKTYEEQALFGSGKDKSLCFWSFQSDGKNAQGEVYDGSDIHELAICFAAQMDAGFARQVYWPHEKEGFCWAVESKNKKGWKRFVEHHYLPLDLS